MFWISFTLQCRHFSVLIIIIFFLYNNGELCGYVILILNNIAQLKKIFILPKLRNNGYGTFFLKYIINWLTNKNFDSLIMTNHKKMNNFLEKQRFIKTEDGYILNNLAETKRQKKNMLSISKFAICINIVLALLKIIAGKIFYSMSLLSDGLNSLSDLITNVLVIVGLKVGSNPEDKEHPFGHGKIESVFSVIIGTFIMITAFELIKDNFSKLISFNSENNVNTTFIPIIITVLAILIKIFQLAFMQKKTKKYNNAVERLKRIIEEKERLETRILETTDKEEMAMIKQKLELLKEFEKDIKVNARIISDYRQAELEEQLVNNELSRSALEIQKERLEIEKVKIKNNDDKDSEKEKEMIELLKNITEKVEKDE